MPSSSHHSCDTSPNPPQSYRPMKTLPFELREHVNIYFGEELYNQALTLLTILLTSGTAIPNAPAHLPNPSHLSLCATLATHPTLTTRAKSPEKREAAALALSLLRLTNLLVGPVAAKFDKAFEYKHFDSGTRFGGRNGTLGDDGDGEPEVELEIAGAGSIWARAEDFWAVVGWAFNCSVVHARRWDVWEGWLATMLDVLETDWGDRLHACEGGDAASTENALQASLAFRYLHKGSGHHGRNRRIMRAIFADGSPKSLSEFREIYKNEPRELKKKETDVKVKKREVNVNIDADVFGDYLLNDDSDNPETEETPTTNGATETNGRPSRVRKKPSSTSMPGSKSRSRNHSPARDSKDANPLTTPLGSISSLTLRLRLLNILTTISTYLPRQFIGLPSLHDLLLEHIRPLPIPLFSLFVLPSALPSSPALSTPLLLSILSTFISTPNPPPSSFAPLTQATLTTTCLPFPATTTALADNTKVSLLLESVLRRLARSDALVSTPELAEAIEEGIRRRAEKVQSGGGRAGSVKGAADDWENGFAWLVESGERMGWVVNGLEEMDREGSR